MTRTAAAGGVAGLPLWAVCAVAFLAILGVTLIALLGPLAKRQQRAKQTRLAEVMRYRMLGAQDEPAAAPQPSARSEFTQRALALVDRLARARGQRSKLQDELERAGLRIRPEEWAAVQLLVPVGAAVLGAVLAGVIGLVVFGALGWAGCRGFLKWRIAKRRSAFEAQLPDALQLLSGALRTGFALNQAIGTVVREGLDPLSVEFGRALREVQLGTDLEDAIDSLAERMHSYDLKLVVESIRTSREVGGNLAEVLETTVATMRERVQLRDEVRTLTAEGRFSAKVLIALPILMTVYLLLFKKAYLVPLYTTGVGIGLLVAGGVLLVVGAVWLQRMTKIEV